MIKRRALVGMVLVAALSAALSMAAALPASAAPFLVRFQNFGNGLCLQPVNDSADLGAAIVQVPCDLSKADQIWAADNLGGDEYHFQNQGNQLCLDARGGPANGTPVQQWVCNTISNENWVTSLGGSLAVPVFSAVAGSNNFCLDVPGASTQINLGLQIYGCNATVAQLWYVH